MSMCVRPKSVDVLSNPLFLAGSEVAGLEYSPEQDRTQHFKIRNLGYEELMCRISLGYAYMTPPRPYREYKYRWIELHSRQKNFKKEGKHFNKRQKYKSLAMTAQFYLVVILFVLSSSYAIVYAGIVQLEHPHQAFCEADFGKVTNSKNSVTFLPREERNFQWQIAYPFFWMHSVQLLKKKSIRQFEKPRQGLAIRNIFMCSRFERFTRVSVKRFSAFAF